MKVGRNSTIQESTTPRRSFFQRPSEQSFFQTVQTKLSIGQPGDQYEVEADAMADRVVQTLQRKENGTSPFFSPAPTAQRIQTKCEACAEEGVQRKEEFEEERPNQEKLFLKTLSGTDEEVQRKCSDREKAVQKKSKKIIQMHGNAPEVASPSLEQQLRRPGGGSPMDRDTTSKMEGAFGFDFGRVRIHTGSDAVQMNRELNAQAFTHGSNIYFNDGKYDPKSNSERHLLAHELTHVVQQGASPIKHIQREVAVNEGPREMSTAARNTIPPEAENRPETSDSGPNPPPNIERKCGPVVDAQVTRVWNQIRADFAGWSDQDKLAACFYLVSPFVPEAEINPRSAGGSELLSGSLEDMINGIRGLILETLGYSIDLLDSQRWQLNRDAFDTLGLFVLSAEWIRSASDCAQPACDGLSSEDLPRGHVDPCEGPDLCSFTVTLGGSCWLSGTANYGTYGIMMKLAYDWCLQNQQTLMGLLPGIVLQSMGNTSAIITALQAAMSHTRLAAALLPALFSRASVIAYVGGYKLWDMENPVAPLSWALATYDSGAAARPAGTNRPNCPTNCSATGALFRGWDYVWEPIRHG